MTPDKETLRGLIHELMALLAGQSPHALGAGTPLAAIGLSGPRMAYLLGAVHACFGVEVSESGGDATAFQTVGELARVLGEQVHAGLSARVPAPRPQSRQKRLLILSSGLVPEFAAAAARRGWRSAVMCEESATLRLGTLGPVDFIDTIDWANPLEVVRRVVKLHEDGLIDAVVPVGEFALLPAALATTRLGLPGASLAAVRNTHDKLHMRRVLAEKGLGQLQYAICRDLGEARAFLVKVGAPIIVKPVSGTGSDGVSRVTREDELTAAFATAASAAGFFGVLCEEYIDGPEVSLEGYTSGGRFVPVAMTDKMTDERFLEMGHAQPSSWPRDVFDAVASVAGSALAALGVDECVSHSELRIAGRGPVLIETHTRMGGGRIHELTQLTTGVDLIDLMVAFALGESVDAEPLPQGRAAAVRFFTGRPGRVRGVRRPESDTAPGIHTVLGPPIGKVVTGRSESTQRLGLVIGTGATPAEAAQTASDYIQKIRVDYFEDAMPATNIHPDKETLSGLIQELIALVAGKSPHAVHDDTTLEALGLAGPRAGYVLGGIQASFGVPVPPTELRPELRTAGELARSLGAFVHDALRNRPASTRPQPRDRRLLILGAGLAPDFAAAAARRGWRAGALIDHRESLRIGMLDNVDLVDAVDWSNPLDVVACIVKLYEAGDVDAIVAVEEFSLLPAALATTRLGIPGLSLRAVRNTRDKLYMRRVLEEAGLGQLHYAVCSDLAEAQAFLEKVGGPIIVKPVSGTGSDGISRVTNAEELAAAFDAAATARGFTGVLLEEFIEGPEVSLEGYSVDGRFVPVALTDKLTDGHFVEVGHTQPTLHGRAVFEAAAEVAGRLLPALGVNDGVSHTEFRISDRGPVIIETHTRTGGDRIHELTLLTTGVDLVDVMVAFALGEPVHALPAPQGRAAVVRFFTGRLGTVSGVRIPAVHAGDGIHSVRGPAIGKTVSGRGGSPDRLGCVIATGPTQAAASEVAERYLGQIRVEYFEPAPEPAAAARPQTERVTPRPAAPPPPAA